MNKHLKCALKSIGAIGIIAIMPCLAPFALLALIVSAIGTLAGCSDFYPDIWLMDHFDDFITWYKNL